ncbi:MAG: tRNA (guanosine(37)-N1)-methyltransferase TrmD [Gemmatimonadetes bacterium]|nr:tRNA (guanosine(37)-N1)-methyltransferase TrmD [Gemmatimonadota bacterium]
MVIDIITAFPHLFPGPLSESIPGRAIERGLAELRSIDLREFTSDRHRTIDDTPYGGGGGMVLKAEPVVGAIESLRAERGENDGRILLMSPRGRVFGHEMAVELSLADHLLVVCGHYKGFDERIAELTGAEEVSLGDFVLSGGELAAMALIDAVLRLLPGALGNFDSAEGDSFFEGTLEGPIYTRPRSFRGRSVPEVLLSGDHPAISRWRLKEALRATRARRPDLLARRELTPEEEELLQLIRREENAADEFGQEPQS